MNIMILWLLFVVGVWGEEAANTNHVGDGDVKAETELLQVYSMFRHGDRTPDEEELKLYPDSEKFDSSIYFPYGVKALTNKGKWRGALVGKYLRKTYDGFISPLYLPDEIQIRSTSYSRTRMTALVLLSALYPPPPAQRWNPTLDWQPVPYDTVPLSEDDLMYWYNCPSYIKLRNQVYNSPEYVDRIKVHQSLLNYLQQKVGANITTTEDVFFIDNLFQTLENVGVSPPKWANEVMPEIKEVTKLEYAVEFATPALIRIASGVLMNDILQDMQRYIEGKTDQPKMRLYSAHENNVAGLMSASRVFEPHQPNYGSTFTLELRQNNSTGQHIVRAVYAKDAGGPAKILNINGCSDPCDYEQFARLVKIYTWTKSDFDKTCKTSV